MPPTKPAHGKPVTETVLKKRKSKPTEQRQQDNKKRVRTGPIREKFKRLESFVQHSRGKLRSSKKVASIRKKMAIKEPEMTKNQTSVVTLIIRNNKSARDSCSTVYNVFRSLKLDKINTAVFVRMTPDVLQKLQLIPQFVSYGQPSLKSVKDIIYKHGKFRIDGHIVPLSDNRLIEEQLGKHNIMCVEDVVNQIHSLGPHFDLILNLLVPISFNNSKSPFKAVGSHFNPQKHKTQPGETRIDALVRSIN
jgi:large subunit ribosomal protein L7e